VALKLGKRWHLQWTLALEELELEELELEVEVELELEQKDGHLATLECRPWQELEVC